MATMAFQLTDEEIARRAYEIFESADSGTDVENWFRAEQELRGRLDASPPMRRRPTAMKAAASDKPSRARKAKAPGKKAGEPEA